VGIGLQLYPVLLKQLPGRAYALSTLPLPGAAWETAITCSLRPADGRACCMTGFPGFMAPRMEGRSAIVHVLVVPQECHKPRLCYFFTALEVPAVS
jgi:hypothetical protein